MLQARKKITAWGLLLPVALPLLFSAFISIRHAYIQHDARERLENSSLQTVLVPQHELYWIKPGKEVLVEGKLFDVKSFSVTNGVAQLTGLFDGKENELVTDMAGIYHAKNGSDSPLGTSLIKYLFFPIYKESTACPVQQEWMNIETAFAVYADRILPGNPDSLLQPPRNV